MKHYQTTVTIALLRKHNPVFFSKSTLKFFRDKSYRVITKGDIKQLEVKHQNGTALYTIDKDNYELTYSAPKCRHGKYLTDGCSACLLMGLE